MLRPGLVLGTLSAVFLQGSDAYAESLSACRDYGEGFFLLPGTDTCLQIAGEVRADYLLRGGTAFARDADRTEFRSRAALDFDARTKTEWGTLRSFITIYGYGGAQHAKDGSSTVLDTAFIQFAGLTAGYAHSVFGMYDDFYSSTMFADYFGEQDVVNLLAYKATFGDGVTGTIALEHGENRQEAILRFEETDKAEGIGHQRLPDLVANLRLDKDWGAAMLSAALHENHASRQRTKSTLGYALGASLSLNVPATAGGYVVTEVTYAKGASRYTTGGIGMLRDSIGAAPDAYVDDDGRLTNVASWAVSGEIGMNLTPKLTGAVFGSYLNVGRTAIDTTGFGEYRAGWLGTNLKYSLSKDVRFSGEFAWSRETIPASLADNRAGRSLDSWLAGMRISRIF